MVEVEALALQLRPVASAAHALPVASAIGEAVAQGAVRVFVKERAAQDRAQDLVAHAVAALPALRVSLAVPVHVRRAARVRVPTAVAARLVRQHSLRHVLTTAEAVPVVTVEVAIAAVAAVVASEAVAAVAVEEASAAVAAVAAAVAVVASAAVDVTGNLQTHKLANS